MSGSRGNGDGNGAKWSMRELVIMVGLAVSLVGLGGTAVGGGMWLGAIQTEVRNLKASTVTDGRISTLEAEVKNLTRETQETQSEIRELLRELRRNQ